MSYLQQGSCPKCGAPIYMPTAWHGIYPPSPQYTCACTKNSNVFTSNTTTVLDPAKELQKAFNQAADEDNELEQLKQKVEELSQKLEAIEKRREAKKIRKIQKKMKKKQQQTVLKG